MALFENQMWDMAAALKNEKLHPTMKNHRQRLAKLRREVAAWEYRVAIARPRCRQIKHLIKKFGGILPFSLALNTHPNRIILYYLGVTKGGRQIEGRTGLLPTMGGLLRLIIVSRMYGVVLTPEDLFPDLIDGPYLRNTTEMPSDLVAWAMNISRRGEPDTIINNMRKLETEIAELVMS